MVQCEDDLANHVPPQQNSSKRLTRVLLVDDQEDLLELLRDMLDSKGFDVLVSPGGPAALKLIEKFPGYIDLLLADLCMPHMGGPELARRARQLRPGMKVLFMSGSPGDALFSGQLEPGAQVLAKPFSGKVLTRHIRQILSQ